MKFSIIGSTGSIGTQSLDVISRMPDAKIISLTANNNIDLLEKQIKKFGPKFVCVVDEKKADLLRQRVPVPVFSGQDSLLKAAGAQDSNSVIVSVTGCAGLGPAVCAIEAGKDIYLANKEALVIAGDIIMAKVKEKGVKLVPFDSEHCAIMQCLAGEDIGKVKKLILTCSGGPFRGKKKAELESARLEDALGHPNWSMGKKITVDSATLMNKGFEVIEARWLFGLPPDKIDVVVHPQSIVHSMVEFVDNSLKAQLSVPDMRFAIEYGLCNRKQNDYPSLDLFGMDLGFSKPDTETFGLLALAYRALRTGGSMPCALNAANDAAVQLFLDGKIAFLDIFKIVKEAVLSHEVKYGLDVAGLVSLYDKISQSVFLSYR